MLEALWWLLQPSSLLLALLLLAFIALRLGWQAGGRALPPSRPCSTELPL